MKKIAVINDMSGYGRCSLTVALPILSVMGYQACPAPTSLLSNHTAYPEKFKLDLTESLSPYLSLWLKNGFHFDALMSGYLGKAEQTETVADYIEKAKAENPEMKVIVDPVMADHGKLYCSITAEHILGMRQLCSMADLISPNLTEACFLSGMEYETVAAAFQEEETTEICTELLNRLHALCRGTVVITGIEKEDTLMTLVSETESYSMISTKKAGSNRPGTGDMFISILTAEWLSGKSALQSAERACGFIADAIRHSDAVGIAVREGVQFEDLLEKLIK